LLCDGSLQQAGGRRHALWRAKTGGSSELPITRPDAAAFAFTFDHRAAQIAAPVINILLTRRSNP
jgi:hypothetical protein